MTEVVHSASQLELFKLCPRRHFYKYILKRPDPSGDAADAGTQVHALIENCLRDGIVPEESLVWIGPNEGYVYEIGKIALAMLKNLPPPGTVPDVEIALALEVDGLKYRGRVDARRRENYLIVTDQKTTSNIRYAKSEEDLKEDIQAILYAKWAGEDVLLEWNFGQSKEKPANTRAEACFPTKLVKLFLTKEEADEKHKKIVEPVARQVALSYKHRDIRRTRQNTDACSKFPPHGCPNKEECLGKKMSIEEKKSPLIDMLRAKKATNDVVVPTSLGDGTAFTPNLALVEDPINAPNVIRTPAPAQVEVVDTLPKKTRKKREAAESPAQQAINDQFNPERLPDVADFLRSEENKAFVEERPQPEGKPIRTLFVSCLPLFASPRLVYAHELIAKAAQTVEDDMQLLHVKLAPFNTGGASLAAQLRVDVLEMEVGFDLVLLRNNPESRDVEQVLCSLAQQVIMGV